MRKGACLKILRCKKGIIWDKIWDGGGGGGGPARAAYPRYRDRIDELVCGLVFCLVSGR